MAGKLDNVRALTPRDATPLRVVSYEYSNLFGKERYNPDDLASRKGLKIYASMLHDEQVKAVMIFRRGSITARGHEFIFPDDSPLAVEERERRIKLFTYCVQKMRGSFQDGMNAVMRGHQFGFSMTEKVFDDIEFDGRPYTGLAALLPRDPYWFKFFTDKYGTLDHVEQWIGADKTTVDIRKFIHYVASPEIDRWYGESDLRAAHRSWYIKDAITKLYAIYLERFAGGFAYANISPEAQLSANSPEYRSLQTALENIKHMASMIMPAGVTLEFFQPAATSEYREALMHFDLAIAKSVLVPNLLGLSHTGQTGAYSQSQTQLETYFMSTANDTARLEDVLNEQLFRDIGDLNFGDGQYPRFRFKPASNEHVKWMIETWQKLTGSNVVLTTEEDEKHLRKLLDMPARTEESKLIAETQMERVEEPKLEATAKYAPKPAAPKFTIRNELPRTFAWDESKHPRHGAGDSRGGQFAPKGGDIGQPRAYLGEVDRRTVDEYQKYGTDPEFFPDYRNLAEEIVKPSQAANMPKDLIEEAQNFLDESEELAAVNFGDDQDMDEWSQSQRDRFEQDLEDYKDAADHFMPIAVSYLSRKKNPSAYSRRRRAHFHRPGGHDHDQQNHAGGGPDPATMRGSAINKELDKIEQESHRLNEELIAAGRGSERPSDRRDKTDALSLRERHLENRRAALKHEVELRAGPGHYRLPRGVGGKARQPRMSRFVPPVVFARAAARVEFAIIEHRAEMTLADTVAEASDLAARAVKKLLRPERVQELLSTDSEDIGQIAFEGNDVGKIKGAFKDGLSRGWITGSESARKELGKAQAPSATFANLRNKAADYFEANGFRMAQQFTDQMRSIIQNELMLGVKGGIRAEEVVLRIFDRLIRRGFMTLTSVEKQDYSGEIIERLKDLLADALDVRNIPAYLNTLVRTNTFEALNEARLAAFEDPDLKDFVVAYEYSAIMDNSTTEICKALDDSIYLRDNPVWDTHRPPNHYNCRSLLVPIFVTDGWDGVESPPPTVQPQDGF